MANDFGQRRFNSAHFGSSQEDTPAEAPKPKFSFERQGSTPSEAPATPPPSTSSFQGTGRRITFGRHEEETPVVETPVSPMDDVDFMEMDPMDPPVEVPALEAPQETPTEEEPILTEEQMDAFIAEAEAITAAFSTDPPEDHVIHTEDAEIDPEVEAEIAALVEEVLAEQDVAVALAEGGTTDTPQEAPSAEGDGAPDPEPDAELDALVEEIYAAAETPVDELAELLADDPAPAPTEAVAEETTAEAPVETPVEPPKPKFNFGSSSNNPAASASAPAPQEETPRPKFNFGNSSNNPAASTASSQEEAPRPRFNFGSGSNAPTSTPAPSTGDTGRPKFKFGRRNAETSAAANADAIREANEPLGTPTEPVDIHLALDIGTDTIKVSYAYDCCGRVAYGKLMRRGLINQSALPANAFYDPDTRTWQFADQIETHADCSFTTVVKIRSLLSLLHFNPSKEVCDSNLDFYMNKNQFPKFYFPVRRKMNANFAEMVERERTFEAEGFTPRNVCEQFFLYIKSMIEEEIATMGQERNTTFRPIKHISLVYPSEVSDVYLEELRYLTKFAFGVEPNKMVSTTRALSLFAVHRGMLSKGEDALIFDLGDEEISVVRARADDKGDGSIRVVVDGADGHQPPKRVGGNDLDEAVELFLESGIANRETLGTPHPGEEGHITEFALDSKQYLLVKEIKKAKMILSRPIGDSKFFENGVPVSLYREVHIQRLLTREQFSDCIGISHENGIAMDILSYMQEELRMPANKQIRKVFVSGGLIETFGLLDFLQEHIRRDFPDVAFFTYDDGITSGDCTRIQSYEDSLYAAAVGGSIASLKNENVEMALSYSYATWGSIRYRGSNTKVLTICVDRGTVIEGEEQTFWIPTAFNLSCGDSQRKEFEDIPDEEFYSLIATRQEVADRFYRDLDYAKNDSGTYISIDPGRSWDRAVAQVALKSVSGGEGHGNIIFLYEGQRVRLILNHGESVSFQEGFAIDRNGRTTPVIQFSDQSATQRVTIEYLRGAGAGTSRKVTITDIKLAFEGIDDFTMAIN